MTDAPTPTQAETSFLRAIETGDRAAIEALLALDFDWWVLGWTDLSLAAFSHCLGRVLAAFGLSIGDKT